MRLAIKLSLLVVTTVLMLGLAEGALRVFDRFPPSPRIFLGQRTPAIPPRYIDPLIGWKKAIGQNQQHESPEYSVVYSANSEGFRGKREFSIEPDKRRIAFLGDSFTFGIGVNQHETFPDLIEGLLDQTRSYNYAISGFGVDQMWMTLRHYANKVDPDIVVVSFIWDDLKRARSAYQRRGGWWPKPTFFLRDGKLIPMNGEDIPTGWLRELEQRSHLFTAWESLQSRVSRHIAAGYIWHLNRALFAAIRDECEKIGTRLLIVHIPTNSWRAVPSYERELEKMGVEFLDLAQFDPPRKEDFFYKSDPHFNPAGHRFVAEKIAEYLAP